MGVEILTLNENDGAIQAILRKSQYSGLDFNLAAAILTTITPFKQSWLMIGVCLRSEQEIYFPIFERIYRSFRFLAPPTVNESVGDALKAKEDAYAIRGQEPSPENDQPISPSYPSLEQVKGIVNKPPETKEPSILGAIPLSELFLRT